MTGDDLILRLYRARRDRDAAKAAMPEEECSVYAPGCAPCYRDVRPLADWCDVCTVKQPLWAAYRSAAAQAGAALRAVLAAGKRLDAAETNDSK